MRPLQTTTPIRAILVSVGGSPAPVPFTRRQHRPSHVWYFCSAGSRQVADEIHAQLDWHPDRDFIEVEPFEELGPCYRELRQAIPALLQKWRVQPGEVLVDYTGGTKTMSAALVLAATELFEQFSYVGGEQRDKGGIGVTVDGREKVFYQTNPCSELAIREVERARDLWAGCLFDAAAKIVRDTAARVPHRLRFEAQADVADAMAARQRLDFARAQKLLAPLQGKLPLLYNGADRPPAISDNLLLHMQQKIAPPDGAASLLAFARQSLDICQVCAQDTASEVFLRELLDNTLRTAAQGRFEDAAARLYRAMEMQGQLWPAEATQGAFVNGRSKPGTALPAPLTALDFCQPDEQGKVQLSLEHLFLALTALAEEYGAQKIIAFGSCVRGEVTDHSDGDLCVVREHPLGCTHPHLEALTAISRVRPLISTDVLVRSPRQWEEAQRQPFGVMDEVVRHGLQLFER